MLKKNPLISVIIPVYNVQDYIVQCIESIVSQTYKNLEIILVDDGSPDECPILCDKWATMDNRIIVIHKENAGLSSARNAGLKHSSGDYIAFVDSDDFIPKDAIEIMYNRIILNSNIGIVSGMIYKYSDGKVSSFNKSWEIKEEIIISSQEFILKTMEMSVSHTVWNKLYRKEMLNGVKFQEGKNNEDTLFMYDLGKVMRNKGYNMVVISDYVYYYRNRPDSICTNTKIPLSIDVINNLVNLMEDCKSDNTQLYNILYKNYIISILYFLISMCNNDCWHKKYFSKYLKLLKEISYFDILKLCSIKNIIKIEIIKFCPGIFKIKYKVFG